MGCAPAKDPEPQPASERRSRGCLQAATRYLPWAKGGGVVPWGPSYQWTDSSLRLHTFATVIGLMFVSLTRLALGTDMPTKAMLEQLAGINAALMCYRRKRKGRPITIPVPARIDADQARAVRVFELDRWLPSLSSWVPRRKPKPKNQAPS